LRWLLFEHVYGCSALETLRAWKRQQYEIEAERIRRQAKLDRKMYDSGIRYSPARAAPLWIDITTASGLRESK
jgi:hypothetical protein